MSLVGGGRRLEELSESQNPDLALIESSSKPVGCSVLHEASAVFDLHVLFQNENEDNPYL